MFTGYRTIIAASVAMIAELMRLAGMEWDIGDSEGLVNSIVVVCSAIAAIFYRTQAKPSA